MNHKHTFVKHEFRGERSSLITACSFAEVSRENVQTVAPIPDRGHQVMLLRLPFDRLTALLSGMADLWIAIVGVGGTLAGVLVTGLLGERSAKRLANVQRHERTSELRDERLATFVTAALEYSSAESARWHVRHEGGGTSEIDTVVRASRRNARQAYFLLRLLLPPQQLTLVTLALKSIGEIHEATTGLEVTKQGDHVRSTLESAIDKIRNERSKA